MSQLPTDPGWVADVGETGSDDEGGLIEVAEITRIELFCDQDVCGWPGHAADSTRDHRCMEMLGQSGGDFSICRYFCIESEPRTTRLVHSPLGGVIRPPKY